MNSRLLRSIRAITLAGGILLFAVWPPSTRPAKADESRSGPALDADLTRKIERLLDAHTTAMHQGVREAIETELERYERRMALDPETRVAMDRTLREVAARPTAEGALIDGRTRCLGTLRDALDRIGSDRPRAIYVSENHDNPAHHDLQLRVIREAFRTSSKLLIGMEMFERTVQKHLDDYTGGRIDEATFLQRVDWKKAWGFDWALYQPILQFAREHRIKVVGLNAPRSIVRKVGKSGLSSLDEEERKRIARDIDTQDAAHRDQFMSAFTVHGSSPHAPDPQNYYEAMCVWDETMAETAARYLLSPKYAEATMVVLAGAGHIAYRFGIPARVARRLTASSNVVQPPPLDLLVIPQATSSAALRDVEEVLLRPPGDFVYFTKDVDRSKPKR